MIVSIVLVILFLVLSWKWMFYRPPNFPPGPPRIPFVGSYLFLYLINSKNLHKAAIALGEYYKSNVIGIFLGGSPTIIALDQKSVKTVLTEPEFDGRPDNFVARMRDPEHQLRGIFFTQKEFWKDQRRFFLRHLRDFGFGRRFKELEIGLNDEVKGFVEMIREGPQFKHEYRFMKGNGLICAPDIFFAIYSSSFLRIATGKNFPREGREKLLEIGLYGIQFHKYTEVYGRLLVIIPWIRHLFPNWSGFTAIAESNAQFYQFIGEIVDTELIADDELRESGEERSNFIAIYGEQMERAKRAEIESPSYHREQLKVALMDFLFAAITTLPSQTSFFIQQLLLNPQCLTRMQAELDEVVGRGRLATLDDRVNLSYTEACIREIFRLETIAPSALAHVALRDCKLEGYDVPANANVFPTLYAFHRDENYWGKDVDRFNPERFLDKNGKLSLSLDQSLPFGAGRRLCAGETFARNMFFLVVTALFQNFNISLPKGEKVNLENNKAGLIRYVPPFWVKVDAR